MTLTYCLLSFNCVLHPLFVYYRPPLLFDVGECICLFKIFVAAVNSFSLLHCFRLMFVSLAAFNSFLPICGLILVVMFL